MGTTWNGIPYPERNDPIAEGASAMQGIAEAVENLTQCGTIVLSSIQAGTGFSVVGTVRFPVAMRHTPIVSIQMQSAYGGNDPVLFAVTDRAVTGFTIMAKCAVDRPELTVGWIAAPYTRTTAFAAEETAP